MRARQESRGPQPPKMLNKTGGQLPHPHSPSIHFSCNLFCSPQARNYAPLRAISTCRRMLQLIQTLVLLLLPHYSIGQGLSWFVHVSDIHISKHWDQKRGPDMEVLGKEVLSRVQPAAVVVTGDLTDSKTWFGRAAQQISEWERYRLMMEGVKNSTGLSREDILDIRGNHDCFDVPMRSGEKDYFTQFADSGPVWEDSRLRFTPLIEKLDYSERENVTNCPVGLLVGIDVTPEPGLKGPTNFLGYIEKGFVEEIDSQLSDVLGGMKARGCSPAVIAYGHYPLGVVAYEEDEAWVPYFGGHNKRLEEVLLRHGAMSYLCGHLHNAFGDRLHRIVTSNEASLAELEVVDWKVNRRFRILAVDEGVLSFVELKYVAGDMAQDFSIVPVDDGMVIDNHIVAITSPPSAFYAPLGYKRHQKAPTVIRALVFDIKEERDHQLVVYMQWFCSGPKGMEYKGQKQMHMSETRGSVFETPWDKTLDCGGYELAVQVVVKGHNGVDSASELRVVIREGASAPLPYPHTFTEWLVAETKWPEVSRKVFLCLWLFHVFGILILPRVLASRGYLMPPYQETSSPNDESKRFGVRALVEYPMRMLCCASQAKDFWIGQLIFCIYLWVGPWVVIQTMEDSPLCILFRHGILCPDKHFLNYTFVSGAHTLVLICFHYITRIIPTTLWTIWVVSTWQNQSSSPLCAWSFISVLQIVTGMFVTLWYLHFLRNMWIWHGASAVFLSPAIGWFAPLTLVWMISARKDLRKLRTE